MKEEKKLNVFGIATRAAHTSKQRIDRVNKDREEKGIKPLDKEDEKKIEASEYKKEKRKLAIKAELLALGIGGASAATVALVNGQNADTKQERQVFMDELNVNTSKLEKQKGTTLEDNIRNEVESLKTPDEILNYIKQIYANEYNRQNMYDIKKEQITFYRTKHNNNLCRDKAKNADNIIRESYDPDKKYLSWNDGVIEVKIQLKDEIKVQKIVNLKGEFKTIYEDNEEVEEYQDSELVAVGKIVNEGINYMASLEELEKEKQKSGEQVSYLSQSKACYEYMEKFINAIVEYENKQIEENTINGR